LQISDKIASEFYAGVIMKYVNHINAISKEIRFKPLNTIEIKIIESLCLGGTYLQIATEINYDHGYIGQLARQIYGLIGQKHKVKIKRDNFVAVLDSVMGGELEDDFYGCHGINPKSIFNANVLEFKQSEILINVTTFWKFDAKNECLVLRTKHPIALKLSDLKTNPFNTILNATKQEQMSGDALLELFKILDNYFSK
jgi:hypothetical protein